MAAKKGIAFSGGGQDAGGVADDQQTGLGGADEHEDQGITLPGLQDFAGSPIHQGARSLGRGRARLYHRRRGHITRRRLGQQTAGNDDDDSKEDAQEDPSCKLRHQWPIR